jgi:hypothetical protein
MKYLSETRCKIRDAEKKLNQVPLSLSSATEVKNSLQTLVRGI